MAQKKLYNTTDIFHLYYIDLDDGCKKYKIKTFSKEWWNFMWKARPRFRIRIEVYYK